MDENRRDFLKTGAAASAALMASACANAPQIMKKTGMTSPVAAPGPQRQIGPNEKINIGMIGIGGRGSSLLRQVLSMSNECQVVAVCELYQRRLNAAVEECKKRGQTPKAFTNYEDVIAMPEVDAVIVATPDHWHAPVSLAAMRKGKDVYCEKPMTHTIAEAKEMADTEHSLQRIVQVGSQTTSADQWWNAKKAIADGMIGKLLLSQGSYHRNSTGGEWNYEILKADPNATGEEHIEWDMWQKPADHKFKWTDGGPERYFRFRKYWDYSGGIATDLFFHVMAPLNLCWEEPQFPWRASGMGGIYQFDDGREVPDTFMLTADYPAGHSVVLSSSMANSTHIPGLIRGHEGTIVMVPHGEFEGSTPFITVTPQDRVDGVAANFEKKWGSKEVKIATKQRPSHMQNFFNCVKSREETVLSARKAYRVQVAITLGIDSYRSGKVLYFDKDTATVSDKRPAYAANFDKPGHILGKITPVA